MGIDMQYHSTNDLINMLKLSNKNCLYGIVASNTSNFSKYYRIDEQGHIIYNFETQHLKIN